MDPVDATVPAESGPPSAPATPCGADDTAVLMATARRLEELAARTTAGDWRVGGLLASRPEVIAHRTDGSTEHVAEARARTAGWISALSPAVAAPLAALLRALASGEDVPPPAGELARILLDRLPGKASPSG